MSKTITFQAIFNRVGSLADGGWRLSLDLPEHAGGVVAEIAALKGKALGIAIADVDEESDPLLDDTLTFTSPAGNVVIFGDTATHTVELGPTVAKCDTLDFVPEIDKELLPE